MAQVQIHSSSGINSSKPMSRLEQMQANLQRKMLQEKEEKMVRLYNENQMKALEKVNHTTTDGPGGGNVRKFFAERRAGVLDNLDNSLTSLDSYFLNSSNGFSARSNVNNKTIVRPKKASPVGWDKSYPLSPIERTNSGSSSGYESISSNPKPKGSTRTPRRQSLDRSTSNADGSSAMRRSRSQIINSPRHNDEEPTRGREGRSEEKRKLQLEMRKREHELISKIKEQQAEIERMRQEKIKEEKAQKARLMRKPRPTQLSVSSNSTSLPTSPSKIKASPINKPSPNNKPPPKPSPVSKPPTTTKVDNKPKQTPVRSSSSDLPQCSICGRCFNSDRLEKHEAICKKSTTKKRKVFDPVKMRTQGTEQEQFIRKGRKQPQPVQPKKSDWRQKREQFIETIRQAKQVQIHLAKGGKLSDLPPPPPMDTSDYIQCPHCKRKFSEAAAERHIPKCQNIRSNKK